MTSKEALEIIGDIPLGDNPYQHFSNDELKKVYDIEYEAIKKDLEVLEILKNILDANTLFRVFPYKTAKSFSDFIKSEEKVKEWLKQ